MSAGSAARPAERIRGTLNGLMDMRSVGVRSGAGAHGARRRPRLRAMSVLARCAAGIAAALLVGAAPALDVPPVAPVETLHRTLIEVMKGTPRSASASRARSLAPVVREVFDFALLARVALGSHWSRLDSAQRARMADVFERYTVASYAARFEGYSGERFETTGTRALKRGRVLVRTLLHPVDDEPVRLDYVIRPAQGGWRIINVVANGVSELALRRAEYDSIMVADGFDVLIDQIESRAAELVMPADASAVQTDN